MKKPDEIKKGLECCMAHGRGRCTDCKSCPFRWKTPGCEFRMHRYALAYIQQLEDKNKQCNQETTKMYSEMCMLREKVHRLEAERDAAVEDIRFAYTSYVGACQTCKHGKAQVDCIESILCYNCENEKCKCQSCDSNFSNWEWRGVQKEEKQC